MLYRYVFDIDLETQIVEISNLTTREVPNLSGFYMKSLVNQNYFIVSCADCAQPTVSIFDHELNEIMAYNMRGSQSYIDLASFEESKYMMQLFYSDYISVGLIDMMMDTKG